MSLSRQVSITQFTLKVLLAISPEKSSHFGSQLAHPLTNLVGFGQLLGGEHTPNLQGDLKALLSELFPE